MGIDRNADVCRLKGKANQFFAGFRNKDLTLKMLTNQLLPQTEKYKQVSNVVKDRAYYMYSLANR